MGQPVSKMTQDSAEEVIYLLFYGKKPDEKALENFKQELQARSHVSDALLENLQSLPKNGHPMKLFCTAISLVDRLQEAHVAVQRRNARFPNCKKFINLWATEVVLAQGYSYRRFVVEDVESCDRFDSPVFVPSASDQCQEHVRRRQVKYIFQLGWRLCHLL